MHQRCFLYDNKLLLTYNYADGSQALTLKEIEAALRSNLTSMCYPTQCPLRNRRAKAGRSETSGLICYRRGQGLWIYWPGFL